MTMGAEAGAPSAAARDDHPDQKQPHQPHFIAASSIPHVNLKSKPEETQKNWNTKNLGLRLAADGASAASAGALVAPLITMIDKAIIENASGTRALFPSLRASLSTLLLRPHHFLLSKPFLLIFGLYTGTYVTANLLDSASSTIQRTPAATTTSGLAKFSATSTANLSLCLYKDSQFTRLFGTGSSRPIPGASYALFAARDMLTIFASFNLPPLIAPSIPLSEAAERYVSRVSAAQFLAPAALQLFSTPLHLLGLDLYNRSAGTATWGQRWTKVKADWLMSSFARMARIVPAFGVGGVVNMRVRKGLMEKLE